MKALRKGMAFALPVLVLLAACESSPAESPAESVAGSAGAGTVVEVTLQEWAVVPAEDSAPAGEITFSVTNEGPDDPHEFVIIRTDLDPADLPTDETGKVDENGAGIDEVVDEIEDIEVGETQELTVALEAGNYVLLCNIYDENELEAHYEEGMRIAFTVE